MIPKFEYTTENHYQCFKVLNNIFYTLCGINIIIDKEWPDLFRVNNFIDNRLMNLIMANKKRI